MTSEPGFLQEPPHLPDQWRDDLVLQRHVARVLPPEVHAEVVDDLAMMGELAAGDLHTWSNAMNRRDHEPVLEHFDPWGRRVDLIRTAPEWDRIGEVAATHGVVATAHERRNGEFSRIHQFALAYLFHPSSALYSCPLAMTDGAAVTLKLSSAADLVDLAVPRLTSRDPTTAWTSGQWMTERAGGSDVGRTETRAVQRPDGLWELTGTKWFTSAVTSQMALTLARPTGNPPGGAGLAMFFVEVRDRDGNLNNLRVLRLKDKLGTRQMPTAELELDATVAQLVGEPANGTRAITPMLTTTRVWNAVSATGYLQRGWSLARDYGTRREAFGRHLIDHPLHAATLADLKSLHVAAFALTFHVVALMGRVEAGTATARDEAVLRLLTPIAKLVTARQAVVGASEALEAFGGQGYIEDTGLPVLLRDAQVLSIWEGTTNVLALDALRAASGSEVLAALVEEVNALTSRLGDPAIAAVGVAARDSLAEAAQWLQSTVATQGSDAAAHGARRWAMTVGRAVQAGLLARMAQSDLDDHGDPTTRMLAERFVKAGLSDLVAPRRWMDEETTLAAQAD